MLTKKPYKENYEENAESLKFIGHAATNKNALTKKNLQNFDNEKPT